jgi:hypothetical protein
MKLPLQGVVELADLIIRPNLLLLTEFNIVLLCDGFNLFEFVILAKVR